MPPIYNEFDDIESDGPDIVGIVVLLSICLFIGIFVLFSPPVHDDPNETNGWERVNDNLWKSTDMKTGMVCYSQTPYEGGGLRCFHENETGVNGTPTPVP